MSQGVRCLELQRHCQLLTHLEELGGVILDDSTALEQLLPLFHQRNELFDTMQPTELLKGGSYQDILAGATEEESVFIHEILKRLESLIHQNQEIARKLQDVQVELSHRIAGVDRALKFAKTYQPNAKRFGGMY